MQKKPPIINIVITAILALLTVLSGTLGSIASNNLNNFPIKIPPVIMPYLQSVWPWLLGVTLAYMGLSIWFAARQSTSGDNALLSRSEHRQQLIEKQNRQRMLSKVHTFWIKGVLEQSLHGAALIALGLQEQPDAIESPWRLVLQQPDQSVKQLPPGTRITQVYDGAGGELLILGDPGSGKTTLLLELVRDLLDRAQKDDAYPIPVVFNLSSWAVKRQPLAAWLVEELNTKYQVPRKLGQSWINDDQVLPLLDGLDEVASESRAACVDAINAYRREHGIVPTVVCSRSTEYTTQTSQLQLRGAVSLQLLTAQQIDDYLMSVGRQLVAVRLMLHDDEAMRELASTPLMLSVLSLAYYEKPVDDLLAIPHTERRQEVFETYVRRMLQRRRSNTRYTQLQTINWLTWLARQMAQYSQTEFHIEWIQPDWLMKGHLHLLYSIILGLVGVLIGILASVLLILFLLFVGVHQGDLQILFILIPVAGPLLGGLLFSSQDGKIQLLENIHWSSVLRLGYITIPLLVVLLGGWVLFGGSKMLLTTGVPIIACILIILLVSGLEDGSLAQTLSRQERVIPNQGIWFSARNSLLFGSLFGSLFGVPAGVVFGPSTEILSHFLCALTIVFLSEIIIGLPFGGFVCIQHSVLRLLLWRAGYAPLNYPRLLDYAADRILLRKVGGGYIFVHRLLLEYFASLDTATTSSDMAKQP